LVDRIEHHVASSGDAVVTARGKLIIAEDYQHRARKVMCKCGGILCLVCNCFVAWFIVIMDVSIWDIIAQELQLRNCCVNTLPGQMLYEANKFN
jgi:hypothetical protein